MAHRLYQFTACRWLAEPAPDLTPPLELLKGPAIPLVEYLPLFDGGSMYITSKNGDFVCLDGATLKPRWQRSMKVLLKKGVPALPPHIGSAALVEHGVIVFDGQDTLLLERTTGEVLCAFAAVHADVLGGVPVTGGFVSNTSGHGLVRLSFTSGEVVRLFDGASLPYKISADATRIYVVSEPDIAALDPRDGSVLWRYTVPGDVSGTLLIWSDKLVFGVIPGQLVALDPVTGKVRWTCRLATDYPSNVIPVNDAQLAIVRDLHYWLIDGETGAVVRQRENAHLTSPSYLVCQFAQAGNLIYSTDDLGVLFALNAVTGEVVWQLETKRRYAGWTYPVIHGGRLYLLDQDGHLLVFK